MLLQDQNGPPTSQMQSMLEQLLGVEPSIPESVLEEAAKQDIIDRDKPDPHDAREKLVKKWNEKLKRACKYWAPIFERMRDDQDFAHGYQWTQNERDNRYVANLCLRVISQRVAFFYAKNPKFVAKRRERILNTLWDGDQSTLVAIQSAGSAMMGQAQAAQTAAAQGMGDPGQAMQMQSGIAQMQQAALPIIQDAGRVRTEEQQLDKIAKTLQLLFEHDIAQQPQDFKAMMKMVVRRACTTGIGWVKIGFERVMQKRPEIEARIADISNRLATLERLSADIHDDEVDPDGAEAEQMRLMLQDLRTEVEYVVREGLALDYPLSTDIIMDPKVIAIKEFLGADWVAQQYILSPNEVKEIYEKDVGTNFTAYKNFDSDNATVVTRHGFTVLESKINKDDISDSGDSRNACVWEIYNKKDGLVYAVCDGYPDFLREPASPDVYTDRFWPWFPLTLNDVDHELMVYPPSDVKLIKDMQQEYNRARQGMREHRRAARPKTVVASGMVDAEDLDKLSNHPDNAIIELNGLQPGQKVDDLLQPFKGPPIDPNLYDTEQLYTDMLRVTGVQEANMGPTGGSPTATQSNIAEASRATAMGSNIDDIDDLLTQIARTGSQILLQEVTIDTVKRIVGEGSVWPEMSRQQIADELWLEIEAGSSGRPNQAQEIANAERIFPMLMQLPGINPEFLAKELIRRLDDRLDLTQAFQSALPSIVALNGMAAKLAQGPQGPGGAMDFPGAGAAQGPAGAANAPQGAPPGAQRPPDQTGRPPPPNPTPGPVPPAPGGMMAR